MSGPARTRTPLRCAPTASRACHAALVYVAECDPLHDEGVAYAQALREAGVPVALEEAAGQMHAFFQMVGILPGFEDGLRLVAEHINKFVAERTV